MVFVTRKTIHSIPITPITEKYFDNLSKESTIEGVNWARSTGFRATPGTVSYIPGPKERLGRILLGVTESNQPGGGIWDLASLPNQLPEGRYYLDLDLSIKRATQASISWALGTYSFNHYKKVPKSKVELVWPKKTDRSEVNRIISGITLTRDLINIPANDLGPKDLARAAQRMAKPFNATVSIIIGKNLLRRNYPAIHAVGRAAAQEPRLIDITWGKPRSPKVTLVGKGVCFDSGGLDIKPASGMQNMKKDMGGAAQALGLAQMIMDAKLPVRLRVLIPAVENAISANAFHPLDVLQTRKGITVEVGNTDAEGRLILCDALAEAMGEKPDLVLDFATLTGAARIALGTDIPALFCNNEELAKSLLHYSEDTEDPLWRLPLYKGYKSHLASKVADISSTGSAPFGGAIKAALFLEHFVELEVPWAHIDLMAYNSVSRPGRPEGGEAQSIRAVYSMLKNRYR